jgi:hypothetical protein
VPGAQIAITLAPGELSVAPGSSATTTVSMRHLHCRLPRSRPLSSGRDGDYRWPILGSFIVLAVLYLLVFLGASGMSLSLDSIVVLLILLIL